MRRGKEKERDMSCAIFVSNHHCHLAKLGLGDGARKGCAIHFLAVISGPVLKRGQCSLKWKGKQGEGKEK